MGHFPWNAVHPRWAKVVDNTEQMREICIITHKLSSKMSSAKCPSFGSDFIPISRLSDTHTVYPKKYAHGFCFAVLCCGYTLTDFPISIRLTSLALWQSNDCPSASKATLMNMDKYFMWIHYERLHNHNKAKHNKTVYMFLGIYCIPGISASANQVHKMSCRLWPLLLTWFNFNPSMDK